MNMMEMKMKTQCWKNIQIVRMTKKTKLTGDQMQSPKKMMSQFLQKHRKPRQSLCTQRAYRIRDCSLARREQEIFAQKDHGG